MLLSCFHILIELVADTESVSSNFGFEILLFFDKLTDSECAFVSGTVVIDSRDFLRVNTGKSMAYLWHSVCTWPASTQYLQVINCPW